MGVKGVIMTNGMYKQVFIAILLVAAGRLSAQPIEKNEVGVKAIAYSSSEIPATGPAVEAHVGYTVNCVKNGTKTVFEVISPKSDRGEVKLQNSTGTDICLIHKGEIKEGKNTYTLGSRKIGRGIYYVVSKLASGEQFADRIVLDK